MATTVIILILLIDQWLKVYVKTHFVLHEMLHINGWQWANLYFIENEGMAFGMDMLGGTILLCFLRLLAVAVLGYGLLKLLRQGFPFGFIICISLVMAGAAGNIFDNILYGVFFSESTEWQVASLVPMGQGYGSWFTGRVVDMFYFPLIDTYLPSSWPLVGGNHFVFFSPIFNFADAAITCGAFGMVFFYRKSLQRAFNLFGKSSESSETTVENHEGDNALPNQ